MFTAIHVRTPGNTPVTPVKKPIRPPAWHVARPVPRNGGTALSVSVDVRQNRVISPFSDDHMIEHGNPEHAAGIHELPRHSSILG